MKSWIIVFAVFFLIGCQDGSFVEESYDVTPINNIQEEKAQVVPIVDPDDDDRDNNPQTFNEEPYFVETGATVDGNVFCPWVARVIKGNGEKVAGGQIYSFNGTGAGPYRFEVLDTNWPSNRYFSNGSITYSSQYSFHLKVCKEFGEECKTSGSASFSRYGKDLVTVSIPESAFWEGEYAYTISPQVSKVVDTIDVDGNSLSVARCQ